MFVLTRIALSCKVCLFFLQYMHKSAKREVPHGLVVKCLTRNPRVLGSSCTGFSEFFPGSFLGQDTSEPQPSISAIQERQE